MERPLFRVGNEVQKSTREAGSSVELACARNKQRSVASGEISCYPRIFREARDTHPAALITMTLQRAKGFVPGNAESPFVAGNGASIPR